MKKRSLLILLFTFLSFSLIYGEPTWFSNPPKESGFFYFAGIGRGKDPKASKEAALADVYSQIVYMIRASVTANSTFEKYVEENEKEARRNSAVYSKVRAKGEAVIEDFSLEKQETEKIKEDGKEYTVFYVLVKVPKKEIEKARERLEKEAAERKANAMGVFAFSLSPDGNIEDVEDIRTTIETVYKEMGFNIKSIDINPTADVLKSRNKMINFIKKSVYPQIKKAIVCTIITSNVRKQTQGNFVITSILGSLNISEVNLETGEIVSSNLIEGKGVSMRKDDSAVNDAYRKLIKSFIEKFMEDPSGKKKDDDYI